MDLVEIFWSIQGEGTEVGRPSVFVRFGGCDLRCAWCDSVETWRRSPRWRLEAEPGSGTMEERLNPASVDEVAKEVRRLQAGRSGLVSITGGEPLLQPEAVRDLALRLREAGDRILLETHGLCVEGLASVAKAVDIVSMDWKLKSDVRRESDPRHGEVADFHDAHAAFLACACERLAEGAEIAVKIVLTPATEDAELDVACARIGAIAPQTPLVLQPVTPSGPVREAPSAARVLACLRRCQERLGDVRVIPQTHKQLGVL
jgi:organic radical activating enzyme